MLKTQGAELRRLGEDLTRAKTALEAAAQHAAESRSQVATATQDFLTKAQVDSILSELGLSESLRAEQLTVEQIIELLEATRVMSMKASDLPDQQD